jgi:nitroimidazol reductase NimA-like FMN-containing flavoprotein (pyridoxamine 5'-phosphate oxidase superfamily)
MFREMRRKKQVLSKEECELVLERGTSGVLAVLGEGGYPYAVPLSYVYTDGKIVFHCAKQGHKLDAIAKNDKVSFCVVDLDDIQPERYTTYFRSVIAFGRARVLEEEEKRVAIEALAAKYTPDDPEGRKQEIEREYRALCVVAIEIDHLSGKEAIELVRKKKEM